MSMSAAKSSSAAPDWERVPFDVNCARCGQDLRGLQDPKCPGCALSIDWAEAVPIEELICEQCGYHLFGLTENRCPECGRPFTWPEALAAHHRRGVPLFEHQWRKRPVRSFIVSMRRALRPRKLWTFVSLHDRPPVKPLMFMSLASLVLAASMFFTATTILHWINTSQVQTWSAGRMNRTLSAGALYEALSIAADVLAGVVIPVLCWSALSFAALMIFRQSMRIYRVQLAHVIRVWAYAVPGSFVWLVSVIAAVVIFTSITDHLAQDGVGVNLGPFTEGIAWGALLLSGWQVIWSLRCGYRHYMRMDNAFGVAIASQIIAVLATATLLDTVSFF